MLLGLICYTMYNTYLQFTFICKLSAGLHGKVVKSVPDGIFYLKCHFEEFNEYLHRIELLSDTESPGGDVHSAGVYL